MTIYQWDVKNGWRPLGVGSEFPANPGIRLTPGQTRTFTVKLADPTPTPRFGEAASSHRAEAVPLRGKHKIRLRFYDRKEEWDSYRAYFEYLSGKSVPAKKPSRPAKASFADSDEFDIPPPT
jgi:hypothetical protein